MAKKKTTTELLKELLEEYESVLGSGYCGEEGDYNLINEIKVRLGIKDE